jgi:23S rRNA (cytosine1962-C5)-methyltransferase
MNGIPKVILRKGKDEAIKRFHPWIFSGAIALLDGNPKEGDFVEVQSYKKEFLATGYFNNGSIAVKILSFEKINPGYEFFDLRIRKAYEFRNSLGLINNKQTNCYRLVYGEGDQLPGLIIDIYNKTAVIQCHSSAFNNIKEDIAVILEKLYKNKLVAIFDKSSETIKSEIKYTNHYLRKSAEDHIITENNLKFFVDWEKGQKTGFFLDQRENRFLLGQFVNSKKVLNMFSYSGAFSLYALKGGAKEVHSVDSSKAAIELAEKNISLNNLNGSHQLINSDAQDYLNDMDGDYDVIILDPPAFAKHLSARHQAIQAYKRINYNAIQKISKKGIIFTFSCSQVVDRHLFNSTIISAAIEAKRQVKILYKLTQAPDHPINAFFPEGEYLKGLVLYVE